MTRLYVNLRCSRCGSVRGVATGDYFGSHIGDEDVYDGLCLSCKVTEYLFSDRDESRNNKRNKKAEIERIIDDLETRQEYAERNGKMEEASAYQYAITRLREVL